MLSGDLHATGAGSVDIIGEAAAGGVRRVVLLSTLGVVTRPFGPTRIAMRALEDTLRESGMEWTILRPGGFASNALWWADSVRARRGVAAPFGDVGVPIIDPAAIAAVAAACMLNDRHIGGVYELTGPEVITPRQQAEAIAATLGSSVGFRELSRDEAKAAMTQSMPAELADDTLDILGSPSPAELRVSPDVQQVLGRAPRPFADWAARNIAAFRRHGSAPTSGAARSRLRAKAAPTCAEPQPVLVPVDDPTAFGGAKLRVVQVKWPPARAPVSYWPGAGRRVSRVRAHSVQEGTVSPGPTCACACGEIVRLEPC